MFMLLRRIVLLTTGLVSANAKAYHVFLCQGCVASSSSFNDRQDHIHAACREGA